MKWPEPGRILALYTLLVIATVALAVARLTWHVAGYADASSDPGAPAPAKAGEAATPDLAPIAALAPFGRPSADSVPQTRLPLELRGAIRAQPPEASTAWIAQGGGPARSYAIGQTVTAGATLRSVGVDAVLLEIGGRAERLPFPRRAAASAVTPAPPVVAAPPVAEANRD